MTTTRRVLIPLTLAGGLLLPACVHVKTDPIEFKEIHIVHDVNIHVDKELKDFFAFEDEQRAATQPTTQTTMTSTTQAVTAAAGDVK